MSYLPAEWHKQSLIQLTWPHKDTDWAYMLDEVNDCFLKIAYEVLKRQSLLIVAPDPDSIRDSIDNYGADIQKLVTSKINTNDTWARDHAFITLLKEDATPLLLDFCFNGWGMKFAANYDNQINNELYFHHPVLKGEYVFCRNFILEGGSIESDGKGSLLTTEQCLLAKNRNEMNRQEVEDFLKETFNLKQVLWLKHGYLAGDDTDSHVDTLARFCPDDTIVYVKCTHEKDEHYKELYSGKIPEGVFIDLAFCKSNPTIEWRQTHGGMILKDRNIPFNPNAKRYHLTFQIKNLLLQVTYYESLNNTFYEDEGAVRLYPRFGVYGTPKIFDSIDDFDIHGFFHEYKE